MEYSKEEFRIKYGGFEKPRYRIKRRINKTWLQRSDFYLEPLNESAKIILEAIEGTVINAIQKAL